jgi:hypothetical protein
MSIKRPRLRPVAGLTMFFAVAAAALFIAPAAFATSAGYTSVDETIDGTGHCANGNPNVNCNIYDSKTSVWLNGGPSAFSGDGSYFFAVLDPSGQANPNDGTPGNLSDDFDAYTNRTFSVSGGVVSYLGGHQFDTTSSAPDLGKIRLVNYADTTNPGGVYILAICSLASGYPVTPSNCKYDAFKVKSGSVSTAADLTISKDANGSNKNTFGWTIGKSVDKTIVKQVGGTATFNYTVTVTKDGGTISDVKVTGSIAVFNPNVDASNNTVGVDITGVTDVLSDSTVCTVTGGGAQTLSNFETDFPYSCDLGSSLPSGELDNTATVSWDTQTLGGGLGELTGNTATFTFSNISFTETKVHDCVTVTDPNSPNPPLPADTCASNTYKYSKTVNVPAFDCVDYNNTATFTAKDDATYTGSASQKVTVCGPAKTGALTMGFWQNKNGQGIITGQAKTGVCASGTWLRQFAPFQDLSATATCAQVATYVYNVIKAANAGGAAMNPMLKAQMLATALDVYFSDPALGGNKIGAASPLGGVAIDLTLICKMIDSSGGTATCSGTFQNTSSAFGGAVCPNTTVLALLTYAAGQSNSGGSTWYGQVKGTQELAKNTFDAINNQVAFKC